MKAAPYGPFPYSAINRRAPYRLPGGARVALWVVTNIEFFALDQPMPGDDNQRPKPGDHTPMVRHWAQRDFGNRVGVFRMMEVLAKHGVRSSVALNSTVCDHHPEIIEDCVKLGWELMGHNRTNTERLTEVPLAEEGALIRESLERIGRATGKTPVGWLGSGLQETWNTIDHLAAAGCIYVADWVNDDEPYLIPTANGPLVSVPYSYELNDVAAMVRSKYTLGEFERMVRDQFDVLYEEGAKSARVMAICLHPFIFGHAHRIRALDRMLAHIGSYPGVWKATGEEIARHYLANGRGM